MVHQTRSHCKAHRSIIVLRKSKKANNTTKRGKFVLQAIWLSLHPSLLSVQSRLFIASHTCCLNLLFPIVEVNTTLPHSSPNYQFSLSSIVTTPLISTIYSDLETVPLPKVVTKLVSTTKGPVSLSITVRIFTWKTWLCVLLETMTIQIPNALEVFGKT